MHTVWVIAQFVLAAALVLSADWRQLPPAVLALTLPGVAIAVWAWGTMGLRRLRVTPTPREDGPLLQHGPYRWIRHPMYSGLLLFTAPLLVSPADGWRAAAWLGLLVVLIAKAKEEERLLRARFPRYADYADRTARFLPGIF